MARQVKRDAVLKRGTPARADRAEEPKSREPKEISDDERLEMFRQSMFQSALPDLPKKPGFHRCWLTTTNPRDPIVRREQIGYRLVRASDLPGWQHTAVLGGQYDGCVMVNEMIAAEIPTRLWERFMANNHHEEPLYSEESLVAKNKAHQEEAATYGAQVIESPGMVDLGKDPGLRPFSNAYGEE